VPNLRAFAMSLSGSWIAPTIVQETLLRAIVNIDSFEPAPISRHGCLRFGATSFAEYRKWRLADERFASTLMAYRSNTAHRARGIPASARPVDDQREALILVGASGFS
jgi:hypothetical protein